MSLFDFFIVFDSYLKKRLYFCSVRNDRQGNVPLLEVWQYGDPLDKAAFAALLLSTILFDFFIVDCYLKKSYYLCGIKDC